MLNRVELEGICDGREILRVPGRLCRSVRLPVRWFGNMHRSYVGNATTLHVEHVTKPPAAAVRTRAAVSMSAGKPAALRVCSMDPHVSNPTYMIQQAFGLLQRASIEHLASKRNISIGTFSLLSTVKAGMSKLHS